MEALSVREYRNPLSVRRMAYQPRVVYGVDVRLVE